MHNKGNFRYLSYILATKWYVIMSEIQLNNTWKIPVITELYPDSWCGILSYDDEATGWHASTRLITSIVAFSTVRFNPFLIHQRLKDFMYIRMLDCDGNFLFVQDYMTDCVIVLLIDIFSQTISCMSCSKIFIYLSPHIYKYVFFNELVLKLFTSL